MPKVPAALPSTSIVHGGRDRYGVRTRNPLREHPIFPVPRLYQAMRRPSLLSQILALNLLMVTAGILVSILAGGFDLSIEDQRWQFLVLALALVLTFLLNTLLLRRRFEPLERLLAMMERVDLSRPGRRLEIDTDMPGVSTDIVRLAASFNRMLERLENERRRSGEMVIGAQEEERKRIARDLHDEVNQSLTALLLRIEAAAQDAPPAPEGPARPGEGAGRPGDGRVAGPGPPAAPHRARRPRPRRGAAHPRARFRPARPGARQLLGGSPPRRAVPRRRRSWSTGSHRRRS